jgi:hypothetical protein
MSRMAFGFAVVSALVMCGFSSMHAGENKPRAVLEQNEYEFPAVVEGIHVTHEFLLKNTGPAPLEVLELKAG